jgi:hypothetical protein
MKTLVAILGGVLLLSTTPAFASTKCTLPDGAVMTVPDGVTCAPTIYHHDGLTEAQKAQQRIDAANAGLSRLPKDEQRTTTRTYSDQPEQVKDLVQMCIAGVMKVQTSPGHWADMGLCSRGFTSYGSLGR